MRLFNTLSESATQFVVDCFQEPEQREDILPTIEKFISIRFKEPLSVKGAEARDRLLQLVNETGVDEIISTLARMYVTGYREDNSVVDVTAVLGAGMNHRASSCADGQRWCSLMLFILAEYKLCDFCKDEHNRNKVYIRHLVGIGEYSPSLNIPKGCPSSYKGRILGSLYNKQYESLDHCSELFDKLQAIPLKWDYILLDEEGGIKYCPPSLEDYEEYCATHQYQGSYEDYDSLLKQSWDYYLGMFNASIKGYVEQNCNLFYNTYAPDSRGRIYVTNATGDFVGIKQIRTTVRLANAERIEIDDKYKDLI